MSVIARRSFVGCPAPMAVEVVELARSFPGLGLAVVRPSSRAFSSWVCVSSFASEAAAVRFAAVAAGRFFGAGSFCVVRFTGRRWRVSVPCLSPAVVVSVWLGRPRLARGGRLVLAG